MADKHHEERANREGLVKVVIKRSSKALHKCKMADRASLGKQNNEKSVQGSECHGRTISTPTPPLAGLTDSSSAKGNKGMQKL